jgi:hypothetical protein
MLTVIASALAMTIVAVYAYLAVAPGAASIPMQWSVSGAVNRAWPRAAAFAAIPAIGIVALIVLDVASITEPVVLILVAMLFVVVQLLHIAMTRKWFGQRG